MLKISVLDINPGLEQSDFNALLLLVAEDKQIRINKFHFYRDARNCLLGDVLTRTEICHATGLKNNQMCFLTNEYGKPYLAFEDNIHFNISHAGNYVVCAVSDEPVGIDIEVMKPFDMKIVERFFTAGEMAYVVNADKDTRLTCFYEIWTKKESRIKWEGKGLHMPLSSFSVLCTGGQALRYLEVFRNDEVICHVCTNKNKRPEVKIINTATFLQYVQVLTN